MYYDACIRGSSYYYGYVSDNYTSLGSSTVYMAGIYTIPSNYNVYYYIANIKFYNGSPTNNEVDIVHFNINSSESGAVVAAQATTSAFSHAIKTGGTMFGSISKGSIIFIGMDSMSSSGHQSKSLVYDFSIMLFPTS